MTFLDRLDALADEADTSPTHDVLLNAQTLRALTRVLLAAKAMRDRGVAIGQECVEPPYMSEKKAVGDFIEVFDGPLQREFDSALADLEKLK